MIWTIYPPDVIFEEQGDTQSEREEVVMGNCTIIVSRDADGNRKIERLISSDPQDYLNPQWQPGNTLY